MDATSMLYDFARAEGIDSKRVDAFLSKISNPQTLDELVELPYDMLKHFSYINDVKDPLYSYIKDTFELYKCEVLTLDRLADNLLDNKHYCERHLQDGNILESKRMKEKLDKYEAIIKQLIQIKFGSIENDW